jgi:hypothetical protein
MSDAGLPGKYYAIDGKHGSHTSLDEQIGK